MEKAKWNGTTYTEDNWHEDQAKTHGELIDEKFSLITERDALKAKCTSLREVAENNLQAWEGEEESVREEHAELIEETRQALEEEC